jgi:DUF4097 and DUF4098 domain-containing protein YvlB
MSSFQKVVKYCAIGFAILLVITIVSGIANAVFAIGGAVSHGFRWDRDVKKVDFSESFSNVESLEIHHSTGNLKIVTGETFKVEAEDVSEEFEAKVNNSGKLIITEKNDFGFLWFNFNGFNNPNSRITIYLPADFVAEKVNIETGAGSVNVDDLTTEELIVSAGAGNIVGSNISAEEVRIDGGVGNLDFTNVNFHDLDLDCGVGNLKIEGILTGKNKIDCGVGKVELKLTGNVNDYKLDVDSGIGTVRLNGEKLKNSYNANQGADNFIDIDGGVGEVRIEITE